MFCRLCRETAVVIRSVLLLTASVPGKALPVPLKRVSLPDAQGFKAVPLK